MNVLPPLIAEKILLSVYIVMFPLAIFYFLNSVNQEKNLIGFISFLYIYNYLFLMGFYNFAISVPLFFLALGYWWKNKEHITFRKVVILNLLLAAIYFSHLISHVVNMLSISLLSLIYFRQRIKKVLINICCMLPSSLLAFNYLLASDLLAGGSRKAFSLGFSRAKQLLNELVAMRILVSHNEDQAKIAYLVSALMAYLFIYTLWKDKIKIAHKGSFIARFTIKDCFLLIFLVMLALYLILPWSIGPGGWVNDRLALLAYIAILGWFSQGNSIRWKRAFITIVTLISLVNVGYIGYYCKILNKELNEYTSETKIIEKNKVILPLFFDGNGKSLRVGIFVNAANYYCLNNGGINLGNYEVQYDYFSVKFKESFQPPVKAKEWVQMVHWRPMDIDLCDYSDNVDYLIIWGKEDPITSKAVQKCYSLIKTSSNGKLRIFKGKV